jgi:hypothetical protein
MRRGTGAGVHDVGGRSDSSLGHVHATPSGARLRRWWPVGVVGVVLVIGLAWATGQLEPTLEALGVTTLLLGLVVVVRRRRAARVGVTGWRSVADLRVLEQVEAVLAGLDPIEHRPLPLGARWPRVSVGPTGVVVIEVCDLHGTVELVDDGLRSVATGRTSESARRAAELAARLRDQLREVRPGTPVRALLAVRDGTEVRSPSGARTEAELLAVPVARLADTIARGEVLPMADVDRIFQALAATSVTHPGDLS